LGVRWFGGRNVGGLEWDDGNPQTAIRYAATGDGGSSLTWVVG
jgi:hypothetical protein